MNDRRRTTNSKAGGSGSSGGLKRTSASIGSAITDLVAKRKLDQAMLDEIEEVLIRADLGVDSAAKIAAAVGRGPLRQGDHAGRGEGGGRRRSGEGAGAGGEAAGDRTRAKPFVVLVVGVNGSGKTTTIGKLAAKLHAEGRSVMLAAGDTFRAAAIDQLKIWGGRSGASVIARAPGRMPPASPSMRSPKRAARRSTCCWSTPPAACRTRRC